MRHKGLEVRAEAGVVVWKLGEECRIRASFVEGGGDKQNPGYMRISPARFAPRPSATATYLSQICT